MKKLHKLKLLLLAAIFGAIPLLQTLPAKADTLGSSTFYSMPDSVGNITESSDGNLWTPSQSTSQYKVYKMSRSGALTTISGLSGIVENLTSGSDGSMWFVSKFRMIKLNSNGTKTEYTYPSPYVSSDWTDVVKGPDGNFWFGLAASYDQKIERITASGTYLPTYTVEGKLSAIATDPAHNAVFTAAWQYDANHNYINQTVIKKFNMDGTNASYTVPAAVGNIIDMTVGSDGNLWFNNSLGRVGSMSPTGAFITYDFGYVSSSGFRRIAAGVDGNIWLTRNNGTLSKLSPTGSITGYTVFPANATYYSLGAITAGKDGNLWLTGASNGVAKIIKVGTGYTDNDEDGLTAEQETTQGSSDSSWDTDNDGLSDLTESTSYGARNDVFCNSTAVTCEYPDPTTKDVYVENDWMEKTGSGAFSGQLSGSQVNSLKPSFLSKNIKLHVDTGQLGGGNEVPYNSSIYFQPQSGQVDFYDYKEGGDGVSRQFNTNRHDIYHYLLTGNTYSDSPGSSGAAYGGDDDLFISYGLIKDNPSFYSDFNTAISGSVMHELGHNLCLTTDANGVDYGGQPASCRYSGIDVFAPASYASVMNYTNQFYQTDYSAGINSPDDHDDWSAIRPIDFIYSGRGDLAHGALVKNPTLKKHFNKRTDKKTKPIFEPSIHLMHRH